MKMKTRNNWTMRAAGMMLVLVLITSSFVGGTFAKYTTSGNGGDSARVAKFGVTITAKNDTMFKKSYKTYDSTVSTTIENSVVSTNNHALVAPGTKEDKMAMLSITGTPEVAVKVEVNLLMPVEPFLKQGTYKDVTTADVTDTFENVSDYYPVKFELYQNSNPDAVAKGSINDIVEYFNGISKAYSPNTNLSEKLGVYTLSWKWDFDENGAGTNDKADTLLGNLASYMDTEGLTLKRDYETGMHLIIIATVTQID